MTFTITLTWSIAVHAIAAIYLLLCGYWLAMLAGERMVFRLLIAFGWPVMYPARRVWWQILKLRAR